MTVTSKPGSSRNHSSPTNVRGAGTRDEPLKMSAIEKIYQTLGQCLTQFTNTSKLVKNNPLRVVFQPASRCLKMSSDTVFRG